MATATPTWTDNVSIVAARNLARGSTYRATFDWRSKIGGRLLIRMGRQGTTALTNGVNVMVRPTYNNDGTVHPGTSWEALSLIAAASSTTISGSDSNSGQPAVNVALITGFAAGDLISIVDASFTPSRLEFHRVSKTATGVLTVDSDLKTTHTTAQADRVINKAEAWKPFVNGGATYEIIFDYGDDTAGESVTIECLAQTLDSYTIA